LRAAFDAYEKKPHTWWFAPAFWKFTLPHTEAPTLLRLLALDGISAATIFPSYAGVVSALRERPLWDFIPGPDPKDLE
jgi:hypothetical protein